jgi:phosphatidylserine decarboxylase
MGTHAGFAAFLNDRVNRQFKKMLNEWGLFLKSAELAGVLNDTDSGWFGPKAMTKMPHFAEDFVCGPAKQPPSSRGDGRRGEKMGTPTAP